MDSGWTAEDADKTLPERALLIRTKTIFNKLTLGFVTRVADDSEPGFWFLVVHGTQLHLSGKW